jgi:hypothetical protein
MIENLDRYCLQLAEHASKYFNWLTGLDNFTLARSMIKVLCAYLLLLLAIMGATMNHFWETLNLVLLLVPMSVWYYLMAIMPAERMKDYEQKLGAKQMDNEICLFDIRKGAWLTLLCVMGFPLHHRGAAYTLLTCPPAVLTYLAVVYLISIDKPPYAKSKAWEWLKSLFAVPHTPALVPAQVPSRPSG